MDSCPTCTRPFGLRRRCYFCNGRPHPARIARACAQCRKSFTVQPNQLKSEAAAFCSRACWHQSMRGVEKVKGTKYVNPHGYVMVKTGIRKWEQEHRLVMATKLGRALLPHEHVHHKNHVKTDNRIRNLVLLSNSEHYAVHHKK